jgi:hypothetical protein
MVIRGPANKPPTISATAAAAKVGSGPMPSAAHRPPIPAPASPAML